MHVAFQKMWPNNLTNNVNTSENIFHQHYARQLPPDTNYIHNTNNHANPQSGHGIGILSSESAQQNPPIRIKQNVKAKRTSKPKSKKKPTSPVPKKRQTKGVYKGSKKALKNKNSKKSPKRKLYKIKSQSKKNKIIPNF